MKAVKSIKTLGRKCQVCGKDPAPNFFFCPNKCHSGRQEYP